MKYLYYILVLAISALTVNTHAKEWEDMPGYMQGIPYLGQAGYLQGAPYLGQADYLQGEPYLQQNFGDEDEDFGYASTITERPGR